MADSSHLVSDVEKNKKYILNDDGFVYETGIGSFQTSLII